MNKERLNQWARETNSAIFAADDDSPSEVAVLEAAVTALIAEVRREVLEEAAKVALVGPQTIGATNGETKWPTDWTDHHHLAYAERRGENQMAQHNYTAILAHALQGDCRERNGCVSPEMCEELGRCTSLNAEAQGLPAAAANPLPSASAGLIDAGMREAATSAQQPAASAPSPAGPDALAEEFTEGEFFRFGDQALHDMRKILQTACDADEADPRELLHEIAAIASRYPWKDIPTSLRSRPADSGEEK